MISITLIEILIIEIVHWFADFVLQTHWQAINKSKNNLALTQHVTTYSICWLLPMALLFWYGPFNLIGAICLSFAFAFYTFGFHWVTDYFTSRLNSKLWAKGDTHNFFVSIGFDQFLHHAQLFGTYILLKNI